VKKRRMKAFTLLEIIVSIGILGLIVTTLLLVYYSIYQLQTRMLYGETVAKKAEFYILRALYDKVGLYGLYDIPEVITSIIRTSFEDDQDLRNMIKLRGIEAELYNNLYSRTRNSDLQLYKQYYKVTIVFELLGNLKKEIRTEVLIPLIGGQPLGDQGNPGGGGGSGGDLSHEYNFP